MCIEETKTPQFVHLLSFGHSYNVYLWYTYYVSPMYTCTVYSVLCSATFVLISLNGWVGGHPRTAVSDWC